MAQLAITGLTVTLASYQWGYTYGRVFGARNVQTNDFGVQFRNLTGTIQRKQKVQFINIDSAIEALRTLTVQAGRRGLPVTFTPDEVNAPGTSWIVDWPDTETFQQTLQNRRTFEIELLEQSPGV